MKEFVHVIYRYYIDDNLSGREVGEPWERYELKYKKVKDETTAKYNAELLVFFAVAEALLQNDLQKYERTLHY